MGRPTKLTPELLEKAKTYLGTCKDKPIWTDKGGIAYVEVNLPSKVGLAIYLGIDKDTITEWCKEEVFDGLDTLACPHGKLRDSKCSDCESGVNLRTEFSVIVKEIYAEQERRLINNGLGGLYKEKTNAMLLAHNHKYITEKTESDITSGGEKIGSPILPEVIAEADRLLKQKKLNADI